MVILWDDMLDVYREMCQNSKSIKINKFKVFYSPLRNHKVEIYFWWKKRNIFMTNDPAECFSPTVMLETLRPIQRFTIRFNELCGYVNDLRNALFYLMWLTMRSVGTSRNEVVCFYFVFQPVKIHVWGQVRPCRLEEFDVWVTWTFFGRT